MSKSHRKRPQASKTARSGNTPYMEAMQGKRRSNAAGPHRPKTDYRRKPKHGHNHEEN